MSKEINQISIKGNNLIINYCDSTINPTEKAALNAVLNGFHITSGLSYKGVKTRCGKVVELELNNIKGVNDLTTMIAELTALQKLSVDNKGLWNFDNGFGYPPSYAAYLKSIPTEIAGCTDLTSLNISYQESTIKGDIVGTTGQIPTEIGKLTTLHNLNMVSMTGIIGKIPTQIGNLRQLKGLIMNNLSLKGQIPTEIGNLTQLNNLNMFSMGLSGQIPTQIGNLTQLKVLTMGGLNEGMNLKGQIPTQIGNLGALNNLSMVVLNGLTGQIPTEIGGLTKLKELYMNSINLQGQIPTEIGNLEQLNNLNMFRIRGLTGQLPTQIGNLKALTNLSMIIMTGLKGQIPTQIGNLEQLNRLNMEGTCLQVDEGGIEAIESLPIYEIGGVNLNQNCILKTQLPLAHITTTYCQACPSCNEINPSEKAALNAVLNGFHITSGLSYKGVKIRCGKVVELELNNIKGVNDLTTMIGELTALQKLSVDNGGLWTSFYDPPQYAAYLKSIPTEIGGCKDLTSLNISYQASTIKGVIVRTTGQIPTGIGNLTELTDLYMLNMEGLTGQIPTEIGNLTELNNLRMGTMKGLKGQIPPQIGNLTELTQLYMNDTCLQVDESGIKAIESLPIYEIGGVNLNQNCITKAELPLAHITTTNCNVCLSCKGIKACI